MHTIRLRGPWQCQPLARTRRRADGASQTLSGTLPPPSRVTVPSDWTDYPGADFRGRVCYIRNFGRPTGIGPGDRIELVIERIDAFGAAYLNDRLLGTISQGELGLRADVTDRLGPRNRLAVEVELPECTEASAPLPRGDREARPGGLIGEVRLEISTAWADDPAAL